MPKLKTNKGVAKRFKITKKGKILRKMAGKRHLAASKSRKRKRRLSQAMGLSGTGSKLIKAMLPYG